MKTTICWIYRNWVQFLYQKFAKNPRYLPLVKGIAKNKVLHIVEREKLGEEELLNALVANFHSVLDVKYALSDEVIWSVYAHPLKELTDAQVVDAI